MTLSLLFFMFQFMFLELQTSKLHMVAEEYCVILNNLHYFKFVYMKI